MPQITYEDAIAELKSMFPNFGEDVLKDVIRQYNGNMEVIVTVLLNDSQEYEVRNSFATSPQYNSHSSSSTEREIQEIESEFGIDLHRPWRTHLPGDLLVFDIPSQMSDEELARQLQNEYDEQASEYALREVRREGNQYANGNNHSNNESFGKMLSKKTKALKNKFMNYLYEKKGYKRVNVSDNGSSGNETELHEF